MSPDVHEADSAIPYDQTMMSPTDETIGRAKRIEPGVAQHPLGRLVYRVRSRRPAVARLIAALLLALGLTLLGVAAWLEPDTRGHGSHQQLGMPPCVSIVLFGVPCPTCGMTTAFAYAVRGDVLSAFHAQPAGLLLALATIAMVGLSLGVLLTGRVWRVNWYRIPPTRVTIAALLIVLGGWIYKIAASAVLARLPIGEL